MKLKYIQLGFGIFFIVLGISMLLQSIKLEIIYPKVAGMLIGEGGILILWGLRELFVFILKK